MLFFFNFVRPLKAKNNCRDLLHYNLSNPDRQTDKIGLFVAAILNCLLKNDKYVVAVVV